MPRIARTFRLSVAIIAGAALAGSALSSAAADPAAPVVVDIPTTSTAMQIAIDGDTVATTQSRSVDVRDVDFAGSTVGASTQLSTKSGVRCTNSGGSPDGGYYESPNRCATLAQADGVTAWSYGTGTVGSSTLAGPPTAFTTGDSSAPTTAVSGRWVLDGDQTVIDTTAKTKSGVLSNFGGVDLLHDVLYVPGDVENTTKNDVLLRDLATGNNASLPVSGCADVEKVQAAGSWLLVTCVLTDGAQSYVVVDRTGAAPDRDLAITANPILLGNGFILQRDAADQTLQWAPLSGEAHDWSTIGTADSYGDVAVSRGSLPTLAWIDAGGNAHAALLPVVASSAASAPTSGTGVPTAPLVSEEGFADHAELTWRAAPASEALTGYVLQVPGSTTPVFLPPDATSYSVTGLQSGTPADVFIKAENAAGASRNEEVAVALQSEFPADLWNLATSLDSDTGALTVSWDFVQRANTDAPISFDVSAGPYKKTGLPASTRAVTLEIGTRDASYITVTANGPRASYSWHQGILISPTFHSPAPAVATAGLPLVTLGTTLSATFTASQGVAPVRVDVREQVAPKNAAFHAWSYPASAQGVLGKATIHATGLGIGASYCFETRTTDIDGVESSWSAPECTAIAIDDKSLLHAGSWKRLTGSSYFHGSELESVNTGSHITTSIRASRVWIITTTCATCGDIGLKVGLTTMWVSLHSSATKRQVPIEVRWGAHINGKVYLVQRSAGHPVRVDGLAYLSY